MTNIIEDPQYDKNVYLHVSTAKMRFEAITNVSYDVDLVLPKGEWYGGKVVVFFTLKSMPTSELFLDFRGVKVGQLDVNGKEFVANFNGHHLEVPQSGLVLGNNTLSVFIMNKYRKDGVGLHSFTD
jgi:hypothetical protein